ncbi:MAG: AhpC/TSA family protein [Bacteroidia bacterium]|nr:AhpC/TSA family protein [Bacteroidia bacterium]
MKRIIYPVLIAGGASVFFACGTKNGEKEAKAKLPPNIDLSGSFTNSSQETVILSFLPITGEQILDSAKLDENGNFKFENLHVPGIGFYTLKINRGNFCPLILNENQKVKITGDAKNLGYTYSTEGSKETEVFQQISELSMAHKTRVDSLGADFQAKLGPNSVENSKEFVELSAKYEVVYNTLMAEFSKQLVEVINANPKSLACITAVAQLDPSVYIDQYKKLDKDLTETYSNYDSVTTFHEQVLKYITLAIGADAPDLNMQGPDGKQVLLSSLKGKVVLLDFWASWCKPCRRDNPSVVKMYKKFKSKGFEIYAVSLDENKDDWAKAIKTDELTWIHVCDFGAWQSDAVKAYDVTAIPFSVLINKEGRIVNKGLRGEQLEKQVKALLGS